MSVWSFSVPELEPNDLLCNSRVDTYLHDVEPHSQPTDVDAPKDANKIAEPTPYSSELADATQCHPSRSGSVPVLQHSESPGETASPSKTQQTGDWLNHQAFERAPQSPRIPPANTAGQVDAPGSKQTENSVAEASERKQANREHQRRWRLRQKVCLAHSVRPRHSAACYVEEQYGIHCRQNVVRCAHRRALRLCRSSLPKLLLSLQSSRRGRNSWRQEGSPFREAPRSKERL